MRETVLCCGSRLLSPVGLNKRFGSPSSEPNIGHVTVFDVAVRCCVRVRLVPVSAPTLVTTDDRLGIPISIPCKLSTKLLMAYIHSKARAIAVLLTSLATTGVVLRLLLPSIHELWRKRQRRLSRDTVSPATTA